MLELTVHSIVITWRTGVLDTYSGLQDLGVFTPQALALTGTNYPGADRNLTFSLAGNSLTGVYPQWLFDALVQAPAPVNVNLSVGHSCS